MVFNIIIGVGKSPYCRRRGRFLLAVIVPGITLASIGATSRFRPDWLKPSIVAGLVAVAVPAVFSRSGRARNPIPRGWTFLLIMPGLAEETVALS